jgi:hypothetical protein
MEHDIKAVKATVNMTCFLGFHVLREKDPLRSQFSFLPEILPPPEEGVKPEDAEHPDEKGGHDQEGPIKEGLLDRIFVSGVRDELDKTGIGAGVTLTAGFYESLIRNQGLRVLGGQDAVKPVAVRAACDKGGIAQLFNFTVIAFIIGLSSDEGDLVPFHHLPVAVALLADLGVELLPKGHYFGFITF